MRIRSHLIHARELLLVGGPAAALTLAAFWLTFQFVEPAPPRQFQIATASKGSPYHRFAEQYRDILARDGVTLTIRESTGSLDNLKLLNGAAVAAGLLQGGIASSAAAPDLLSLGRVFYEPVWIFYRASERLDYLAQLRGRRVLVGTAGSGTNLVASTLLAANDITAGNTTLIASELTDYVDALEAGTADAGILVLAPEARTIQRLLASPNVRLMSLVQADAYTQRFPFLSHLVLRQGVVDFGRNVPASDTALVATTTALVVRHDLHPALVNLLTQAAIEVHGRPLADQGGGATWFQRPGQFPVASDPEFPLSEDARRVYKSGPPFLQRYLPFWLATLLDRLIVLALPIVTILLPLIKFAPMLYRWRVRRRLLRWYRALKALEQNLKRHPTPDQIASDLTEVDRIDEAVSNVPIPLGYTDQLYELRQHIAMVRQRIVARQAAAVVTAPTGIRAAG